MAEENVDQPTVDSDAANADETTISDLEQIAKEVLAGKWGRGQVRNKRLEEAGHDPKAVRDAVIKQLGQKT